MKWFIALNHAGHNFDDYADLAKVAIHSAQRFTKLEPHCLYDGPDCDFTAWLARCNVPILHHRFFLYDRLADVARRRGDPRVLAIGGGAFLRTELPTIADDAGIADEFVLYTDVDVMLLDDVTDFFATQHPEYFAVAPELDPKDLDRMNTGVMWMNLRRLRE